MSSPYTITGTSKEEQMMESCEQMSAAVWKDYESFLKLFKKDTYEEAFDRFMEQNSGFLQLFSAQECKKEETAEALTASCNELCSQVNGRNRKSMILYDASLFMAVYVLPSILKVTSGNSEYTDCICSKWGESFPEHKIKAAEYSSIAEGFHNKLCYITTAVCRSRKMGTECRELRLIKKFRDEYLMKNAEGQKLVAEYYDIAPTILKRIDHSENADQVYENLWINYLKPCVNRIDEGKNQECLEIYSDMVKCLRNNYIIGNSSGSLSS